MDDININDAPSISDMVRSPGWQKYSKQIKEIIGQKKDALLTCKLDDFPKIRYEAIGMEYVINLAETIEKEWRERNKPASEKEDRPSVL